MIIDDLPAFWSGQMVTGTPSKGIRIIDMIFVYMSK